MAGRTLDEIKEDHDAQVQELLAKSEKVLFPGQQLAHDFARACLNRALERMGMPKNAPMMKAKMLDMMLKRHRIMIQPLNHYIRKEVWKNGLYIYKLKVGKNEIDHLAYFISTVKRGVPSRFSISQAPSWVVLTNVVSDERDKKFFSISTSPAAPKVDHLEEVGLPGGLSVVKGGKNARA